jgi:signal transduction histidine kinase
VTLIQGDEGTAESRPRAGGFRTDIQGGCVASQSLLRGQVDGDFHETAAEEAVRKMVARELHDRVAQTLTGMLVDVENFKSQQVGWDDVIRELDTIQSSTRNVLASLRQLLHDLRGGEDHVSEAFIDAIQSLIVRFEERSGVSAKLEVGSGWPRRLSPPASLNLYRIVEEALANVRMHSDARHVRVALEARPDNQLAVTVEDDGRGVELDAQRPLGLGTIGMRERAVILGGQLCIESEPATGTRVCAVLPMAGVVAESERHVENELAISGSLTT